VGREMMNESVERAKQRTRSKFKCNEYFANVDVADFPVIKTQHLSENK
jgi:hypothetical protein